jgi:hypothetical protein
MPINLTRLCNSILLKQENAVFLFTSSESDALSRGEKAIPQDVYQEQAGFMELITNTEEIGKIFSEIKRVDRKNIVFLSLCAQVPT